MKNKKLALLLLSSITCVGVGVATIATVSQAQNYSLSAEIEPGVVTIDVNDPNRRMDKGSGYISFASALNNEFSFVYNNVTISEGKYVLEDNLYNTTALHGIYKISINSSKNQTIYINYGRDNAFDYGEYFTLTTGLNDLDFEAEAPAFIRLSPDEEPFEFISISIFYTCVAPVNEREIGNVTTNRLGAFQIYENRLFATEGTTLNEINLNGIAVETTDDHYIGIGEDFSEVTIAYNDASIADSTVVVNGGNIVTISFKYNGWRYYSDNIELVGYTTIEPTIANISLYDNEYKIQSSDETFPENFTLSARYYVNVNDSNGDTILTTQGSIYNIEITSEMIVSMDEHPFSVRGQHNVTIQYQGFSNTMQYNIYDPSYCNIRAIYLNNTYEVQAGTSKAQFLDEIKDFDFYISYYEYDESLPSTTKLTESNFPTLSDDTFNGASTYIGVDVVYETYVGVVSFRVALSKGEPVKTYTSTGVQIMGGYMTVVAIKIYDNGVAELLEEGETSGELVQYTKEGTTLTISFSGVAFKFTVDDDNNTFTDYQSSAGVIRSFGVDFSALGGGSDLYDGTQYDDGTVSFFIEGMQFNCDYTEDTSDSRIIYFNFNSAACVGTFNEDYTVLTVSIAS